MTLKLNNNNQEKPPYTTLAYLYAYILISWNFSDVCFSQKICYIKFNVSGNSLNMHTQSEYEITKAFAQQRQLALIPPAKICLQSYKIKAAPLKPAGKPTNAFNQIFRCLLDWGLLSYWK